MKKIIYAAIALLTLGSCSSYIDLDSDLPEKRLILNALLNSGNATHDIFLHERVDSYGNKTYKGIKPVSGATVTCYVNGEAVAVATEYNDSENDHWYDEYVLGTGKYILDVIFRPGDEVRIEARKGDRTAYAEVTVPQAVEIELLDVRDAKVNYSNSSVVWGLEYTVGIDDIKGKDTWFRVGNAPREMDMTYHFYYKDGTQIQPDGKDWFLDNAHLYIEEDPILNDGYMPEDRELLDNLSPTNTYRVFTDSQFKDRKGEVKFSIDSRSYSYPYFYEEWEKATSVDAILTQEICIETLSYDTYSYYRALNAAEVWGYQIDFISEPVIIPTNVVGGLGFVGIAATSTLTHVLPPVHYNLPDYMYDYYYGENVEQQ